MEAVRRLRVPWTGVVPWVAVVLLAVTWHRHLPPVVVALVAVVLIAAVLASVHHAEVVAHRVGEPLGSVVLAVSVTVIEVALIVTLMVSGSKDTSTLARDTVFAAVMISTNGIVGLALVVCALRHHLAHFNPEGTGSALATVLTLAGVTLVLPRFTTGASGGDFSPGQLAFAAVACLALYVLFIFTQTVRYRDFFLPTPAGSPGPDDADGDGHADPPSNRAALVSLGLLVVSLVGVVGLAKAESEPIEDGIAAVGFPPEFVGVVIALVVLLPETLAATRAASRNLVQTSLNLGYGSSIASIGLTVPSIALASIWLDGPLTLGLEPVQIVLLTLTAVVSALTVVPGRAKPLNGGIHLVLLAAWLYLSINP